jgi:hypothetical protein
MKYSKLFAIAFVVIVFVLFFMNRPVREKACPLTARNSPESVPSAVDCVRLGGIMDNGYCACPP